LLKAGLANEKQGKKDEAKKIYEKVRDNYPNSDEGRDIEKYIARVSAGA
jgi:TolA-binding protein